MIHCPTALIVYPPARAAETSTGCDRAALGHLQGELCPWEMRRAWEAQPSPSALLAARLGCMHPVTSQGWGTEQGLQRCTGCSQVRGARMEKKGMHRAGAISLLKVHCLSCELTLSASCSPPAPGPYTSIPRHFIPFIFSSLRLHGAWPHLSFVLDVLGFHPGFPSMQPQFCCGGQ